MVWFTGRAQSGSRFAPFMIHTRFDQQKIRFHVINRASTALLQTMEQTISILPIVYQKPDDLVLSVLNCEIPVRLNVLRQTPVDVGTWRFTFSIIGESHCVRVEQDGELVFHEVLACVKMPEEVCTHHHAFTDRADHTYRHETYGIAVWFDYEESSTRSDRENQIEVVFPEVYGHVPLTQVSWRTIQNGIRWTSLHAYPQPEGVVFVRSASQFVWH